MVLQLQRNGDRLVSSSKMRTGSGYEGTNTVSNGGETGDIFAIQARQRRELAEALKSIPGGLAVVEWFEGEPEFGDAEVSSFVLDRNGARHLSVEQDWRGRSATITFRLCDWIDAEVKGFSHQNVLGGLRLQRAGERDIEAWERGVGAQPGEWLIVLEPCFGMYGTIRAGIHAIDLDARVDGPTGE